MKRMEIGAWRLSARESSAGGRLSTKRKLRQIVVVSSHGHPEHANEVLTNCQKLSGLPILCIPACACVRQATDCHAGIFASGRGFGRFGSSNNLLRLLLRAPMSPVVPVVGRSQDRRCRGLVLLVSADMITLTRHSGAWSNLDGVVSKFK